MLSRSLVTSVFALAASFGVSGVARAQETMPAVVIDEVEGVPKGTIELRLNNVPSTPLGISEAPGLSLMLGLGSGNPTQFALGLGGGGGYFIQDNLELGGFAGFNLVSFSSATSITFPFGVFGRYLKPIQTRLNAWGEGSLGLILYNQSAGAFGSSGTATLFSAGVSGGVDYQITRSLSLFGGLGVGLLVGNATYIPISLTYGMRGYI